MKKTVLVYGILGGALIAVLKVVEYRYLVVERSLEIYGGLVAILFSAVGIWLGSNSHGRARRWSCARCPFMWRSPFEYRYR